MDDLYREVILVHYQHPHNHGTLPNPDISFEDSNPLCGDKIRVDLKVKDNIVQEVRFSGKGCAISQASASMLTDELVGKSLDEIKEVLSSLGLSFGMSIRADKRGEAVHAND